MTRQRLTTILLAGGLIGPTVVSTLDERGVVPNAPTGLLQRVAIVLGWSWIALLALRLLRLKNESQKRAST